MIPFILLASAAAQMPAGSVINLNCQVVSKDSGVFKVDLSIKPHPVAGNLWTITSDLRGLPSVTDQRDVRKSSKFEQKYQNAAPFIPYADAARFQFSNELSDEKSGIWFRIELANTQTEYDNQPIVSTIQISSGRSYVVGGIVESEKSYIAAGLCRKAQESEALK